MIISYEPDNAIKKGYISSLSNIARELAQNRWLILQLFKRDFLSMYKQSFMGILWAFIIPIISVGTFIILNRSGIFNMGDIRTPYPLFAVLGIAFWQLFSTGVIASSNSLVKAGSLVVKINFSRKSLVLASLGQSLVSFLIQILFAAALLFYYGIAPHWQIVLLPVLILPTFLFTAGLGFILSILNGIMRDIGNAISVLMTFFMFLTPVLYVKPAQGFLSTLSRFNPVYYFVAFPRDLILKGSSTELTGFLISSGVAVVVFMVCIFTFHLAESRVTERI